MGKGKIAAQCCHAAVGVVMDLCEEPAGYSLMMQWVRLPSPGIGNLTITSAARSHMGCLSLMGSFPCGRRPTAPPR